MSATNTAGAGSPNPSTFYNNGRALLVSVNDFSKISEKKTYGRLKSYRLHDLVYTHISADYFKMMLHYQYSALSLFDYKTKNYRQLKDSEATYQNVIAGIMALADESVAGDVVTITFSTHGFIEHSQSISTPHLNLLALYDEYLDELELYLLLKLFRQGVRVFICFDHCHSSSWVFSNVFDHTEQAVTHSNMAAKLENAGNQRFADKLLEKYNEFVIASGVSASVCLVGGVHDMAEMTDSYSSARFFYETLEKENQEMTIGTFISKTKLHIYNFLELENGAVFNSWYHQIKGGNNDVTFNITDGDHRRIASYFMPSYYLIGKDIDVFHTVPAFGLY